MNQKPSTSYLPYSVRTYSSVLQAMAPHVHAVTKKRTMPTDRPLEAIDQSQSSSIH